ncbi:TetR/AcrR family transcriptional regulator [Pseudogemmobacter humi]|uniref:DNA-binding transcriptional repressor AcrR n=1 Tax=Pseudogemmobacter humi TaxID=2483812 RepID=A0A3P5WY17_9RHOB|nr:TetR/AcrR family transcriptional regulator [Pseudogemmobacter humi]VDC19831.1 DNA-binding transcriptional repressor AcrR [Pseudogemmobacter humi]
MRADALRNRNAVLDAAARIYSERGFDVAMADIAAEAGVGRTTLLRNFPSRMELASALFERAMEQIRSLATAQKGEPGDLEELLDLKLSFYIENGGLAEAVQKESGESDGFRADRCEVARILLAAARPSIETGLLRKDLTLEVFLILQQAIAGAMRTGGDRSERSERARIVRSLLLDGLRRRA